MTLEDVQNRRDTRKLALDQAGVSDIRHPIVVLDRERQKQATVATIAMSVNLPHEFKGTHMSRFIEVLSAHRGEITLRTLPAILDELKQRLHAKAARMEVSFPYFLERRAPVTGATALMDYQCAFVGESNGSSADFRLQVTVPVTSLCPCSKAISDYGAHNQRGLITIDVRTNRTPEGLPAIIWIEELVDLAEQAASAPVYPLLKRADERFVTMQAYDNPVFVEDMVRTVALGLQTDSRVAWFRIHAANQESIHNHSAFARIEWPSTESAEIAPPHLRLSNEGGDIGLPEISIAEANSGG
ncbi:MAG TPA: GTP cyclohydrolase FolE2 [Fimbriimonas sp.]|nr:GTP cyclohydrolase FolE2 [Fimbriimonas sp.]